MKLKNLPRTFFLLTLFAVIFSSCSSGSENSSSQDTTVTDSTSDTTIVPTDLSFYEMTFPSSYLVRHGRKPVFFSYIFNPIEATLKGYCTNFSPHYFTIDQNRSSTPTKVPNTYGLKTMVLRNDSIRHFFRNLKKLDNIDLEKEYANYDIVIKPELCTEDGDNYVGLIMYVQDKTPDKTLTRASTKANPCPPCNY